MQVFYNPEADAVPIHTDPALEVESVHKACKANFLRMYKVLLVISLIPTLLFLSSVISDTLRILSSPMDLMTGVVWLCLFLLCAVELTAYYRWYRRARKVAEHDIFLDTPSTALFQQVILVILVPFIAYWAANLIFGSEPLMAWVAVMVFLCFVAVAFLVGAVKQLLKRRLFSSIANRLLSAAFSFIITYLLIDAVISVGIHIAKNLPAEQLFPHMETTLRVSDLMETEYSDYLTTGSPKDSLLMTWLDIHQRHGFDDEASPDIPEIRYRLLMVKVPEIYDFCAGQMKRLIVLSASWDGEPAEQDAAPWGADRAYRLVTDDGTEKNVYLLCYQDRLTWIEFNWTPITEQMTIVGEKLCNK